MIHVDIAQAMSGLDDDLLDEYLTLRAERNRRLERRRMIRKRCLTAAACLLVVLSVMAKAAFDCRYPYIPMENAVGDVSVRYVPEWMAEGELPSHIRDYTDNDLFDYADCVFSGTVSKIDHIKISSGKRTIYNSIVTIQVDHYYQGDSPTEIRLFTPPIHNNGIGSNTVLNSVDVGSQGIFITKSIAGKTLAIDNASICVSDVADAKILDEHSFAFIYDEANMNYICYDTINNCSVKIFTSLNAYDTESVSKYIQKMTTRE